MNIKLAYTLIIFLILSFSIDALAQTRRYPIGDAPSARKILRKPTIGSSGTASDTISSSQLNGSKLSIDEIRGKSTRKAQIDKQNVAAELRAENAANNVKVSQQSAQELSGSVDKVRKELNPNLKIKTKEKIGAELHNAEQTQGVAKKLDKEAADLVSLNKERHRVTLRSPSQKMEVDLAGKSHGEVPTPHTKVSPRNLDAPNQPAYNTKNSPVVEATQKDIRTVRKYLQNQNR